MKVHKTDSCWEWTAAQGRRGYGVCRIGRERRAHRASYIMQNGPIPGGLWVLHRCDNPPCVRPDHLFLGTAKDNSQDMSRKGRSAFNGDRNPKHTHPAIGMAHPQSKLTNDKVIEIRRANSAGTPQNTLAARFNVSTGLINAIIKGRAWRHLP